MNKNWFFGLLIGGVSIASVVFVIKGNLYMAVLFLTAIFALSNGYRAISFKEKGFVREAKWMKGMSILFTISFFVVLATILF